MDIKGYNKALASQCRRALSDAFLLDMQAGYDEYYYCSDTDTVRYKVAASKDQFRLNFYFVDLNNVWKYIESHFRQHYYNNFAVSVKQENQESVLEIVLNNQGFTSLNKNTVIPQSQGLTGRKKFDPLLDILSKRLASVKRHFLASPFEIMLQVAKENAGDKGNRSVPNFSFYLKPLKKQKVWLAFEKSQVTVYYGIHFEDRFQQQLAKIFFSELTDAKKHVHNSPSVSVSDRQFPKLLVESFPEEKTQKYNFANGIISFTVFGNLVKDHRSVATTLAGFRNYSYYHIQAWKVYLHSRVLRRINIILKDLELAEIEPFPTK